MGDAGHHWVGLCPKPRRWSWFGGCPRVAPEGVAQSERTPKMVSDMVSGFREVKAWIHTCAYRCRQLVSSHCSGVRWGSQWVTGVEVR